jgi:hypothetical protein
MYLSIDGFRAQARVLEAAAKTALTQDNFHVFSATMRFIRINYNTRNEMAHWTWGVTDFLPDALVILEPKIHKKLYSLQFNLLDQDLRKIVPRLAELNREQEISTFVYRESDLAKCADDMFSMITGIDTLSAIQPAIVTHSVIVAAPTSERPV